MEFILHHNMRVDGKGMLYKNCLICALKISNTSLSKTLELHFRLIIVTSKSETMVLSRKRVECSLRVGNEILPQVKEFKYLGVLFTSEGRMEREVHGRICAASAVLRALRCEEGATSCEYKRPKWVSSAGCLGSPLEIG